MQSVIQVQASNQSEEIRLRVRLAETGLRAQFVDQLYGQHKAAAYLWVGRSMTMAEAKLLGPKVGQLNAPCLVFMQQAEDQVVDYLVAAHVAIVYVGSWPKERFQRLFQVAQARYEAITKQQAQLQAQAKKLAEVQLISQAKGKLMQQQNVSESRAHSAMQRLAMSRGVSMAEIARQVIQA